MSKTIPKHGIFGLLIILVTQIFVLLRVPFFFDYYFPLIWLGYIFLVDGLVHLFKGRSLLAEKSEFIRLFLYSTAFWAFFELVINLVYNFHPTTTYGFSGVKYMLLSALTFSTVLPAIFETTDLINALRILGKPKSRVEPLKLNRGFLYLLFLIGFLIFLTPIFKGFLIFPVMWFAFLLIFDSINYMNKEPSILQSMTEGESDIPMTLMLAGAIVALFWEFWNYWAYIKWSFMAPFFDYYRLFEVQLYWFAFLLLFPLQLFAMYHFSRFAVKRTRQAFKGEKKEPKKVVRHQKKEPKTIEFVKKKR
ncbi:hypothetical protein A3K63_04460 [Candidatus Micrarchaeota archaeon RBG_16_49_10]|nr:MAG: hypothetical protein A3K63_04460 [Candidatus Micrarchaeota archaeon RBG_16_49_10]